MTHSFFEQNHVLEIKFWWSICKIKILNMFFYILLFNSCKKLILNSRFNLITERNFKFNIKVFIVILNVKICDNSVVERKIPLQISSIRLPTAVRWNITALEIQLLFIVGKYVIRIIFKSHWFPVFFPSNWRSSPILLFSLYIQLNIIFFHGTLHKILFVDNTFKKYI